MKSLLASVALVAIAGSPAFAQSLQRNTVAPGSFGSPQSGMVQYAPGAVFEGGQYLGSDPDPQIRLDLLRQGAYYSVGGNG
jgi:hypothetical protein